MHRKRTQLTLCILSLFLTICILISGCVPDHHDPEPTTAAPYLEQSPSGYEHLEEKRLAVQRDFDERMEALFQNEIRASQLEMHFLLKDPSTHGITAAENLYSPISLSAMQERKEQRESLQDYLDSIDSSLLTTEQKITYRILQSLLQTEALGDGLELYTQPLATTIGTQAQLPILLCEYQFDQKEDVDTYLELLAGIDEYYNEILEFEQQKADAGLMMSDTSIDHIIESCEHYLLMPGDNFMIDTFNSRLDGLTFLSEEEKQEYRAQNEAVLESDFVPAYQALIDGLTKLKGTGTNELGLCGYENGKQYYEYLVYSQTGTSYASIDDLLAAMEKTMNQSLMKTTELLKKNPKLIDAYDRATYRYTEPADIMASLQQEFQDAFPEMPTCSYTFKDVPKALELSLSPAFYLVSPIDAPQENVIYINHNERYSDEPLYHIIAHEGYPGHMYQNVYFHTHCTSNIRKLCSFSGYSEGWATYIEHESYLIDNGLEDEVASLMAENKIATLGLHACLDVYINYKGWTREQTRDYLKTYYQQPESVADSIYDTMIENPANYLSYYVGYMEFQTMRTTAEAKLGKNFDAKAFHTFLLDMGNAPFDVIQSYFSSWLLSQKLN